MVRLLKDVLLISLFVFFCSSLVFAEDITITTYYPSPYGSYNFLQADKLGVGDNNGVGGLTAADVPVNPGNVWIHGSVNIGMGAVDAAYPLEVNGTIKATGYRAGALAGYNNTITIRDGGGLADCTITVTNGIITATTC
jgi:hypothetical protein